MLPAIHSFHKMDSSIEECSALLQSCGIRRDLMACMRVYAHSVERGLNSHCFLGGHFIRAFALCGSLSEASKLFLRLPEHNVFTCSAIISAHVNNGLGEQAIQLFKKMIRLNIKPDGHAFVAVLKACAHSLSLLHGMLIHYHIVESSLELDCHIGNTLVDMYGRNCHVYDARKVFGRLGKKDVVTWNTIIAGYAQHVHCQEALQLFQQMEGEGIKPDNITFVNILKACCSKASFYSGKVVHAWIIEKGYNVDAFVWSTLIDMYSKFGSIEDARMVFNSLSTRDVVTWSTMIAGHVVHGAWEQAIILFKQMQRLGMYPDQATFVNVLKVISETIAFEEGKLVHACVVERACDHDVFIVNTLVDMYAKCSSLADARMVFDRSQKGDVVAWSALIAGYFQNGFTKEAFQLIENMQEKGPRPNVVTWNVIIAGCIHNKLDCVAFTLFKRMQDEGIAPDSTTYVALLKACSNLVDLNQGKLVHAMIIENGVEMDIYVGNTLIDMYSKFGNLGEACEIFSKLPKPDVVTWNAMIEGFAQHGFGEEAIHYFHQMQQNGWKPNKVTILSVLKACTTISALKEGMSVHHTAAVATCESENSIRNSLIDMYARCGRLDEAFKIFEKSSKQCRETWNAIISGAAQNGKYKWEAYMEMRQHGVEPDKISYLCLLSACSHLGLLVEGCNHFVTMKERWKITPTVEHYGCMVDLWGRVGCLKEAHQILLTMPLKPNIVGWMSLMHHSQVYGRFDIAKQCLDQITAAVGCRITSVHTLMSNFFGNALLHGIFDAVRGMDTEEEWRKPGKSFIEADGKVHSFLVGDKSHEASEDICAKLKSLFLALKSEGFVPHRDMIMQKMLNNNMKNVLSTHLEELAIAPKSSKSPHFFYSSVCASSKSFWCLYLRFLICSSRKSVCVCVCVSGAKIT